MISSVSPYHHIWSTHWYWRVHVHILYVCHFNLISVNIHVQFLALWYRLFSDQISHTWFAGAGETYHSLQKTTFRLASPEAIFGVLMSVFCLKHSLSTTTMFFNWNTRFSTIVKDLQFSGTHLMNLVLPEEQLLYGAWLMHWQGEVIIYLQKY